MTHQSADEAARIRVLQTYQVLDTAPEPDLDDLVALAAVLSGASVALIGMLDREREWFKASLGLSTPEVPRAQSLADLALLQGGPLWLDELTTQKGEAISFWDAPPISARCAIILPLRTAEGAFLGALSVLRATPLEFNESLQAALVRLTRQVLFHLEARRTTAALARAHLVRARMERQRQQENELLHLIIQQSGDGIIVADEQGLLRIVNPEAQRQHGLTQKDLSRESGLYSLEGRPLKLEETPLQRAVQGEELKDVRWLVGRPDGTVRTLSGTASPLRRPDGSAAGGVLVTRDETVRLRLEDELKDRAQTLVEANARLAAEMSARISTLEQLRHADRLTTVGKLASGIAHELGTPLAVISGRAKMIASGEVTEQEARDGAAIIARQSERMARIIRQLLDFARRRGPKKEMCDLRFIARQTVTLLSPLAEKSGVSLQLRGPDNELPAEVDSGQIEQALTNLVINGIQAMKSGGELSIELTRSTAHPPVEHGGAEDEFCVVEVTDGGEGISPTNVPHIFEPFFTTKGLGEGTGLGLSVTYGIVREHGGWIAVASEPGRGSRFSMYLPARVPARVRLAAP